MNQQLTLAGSSLDRASVYNMHIERFVINLDLQKS